MCLEGFAYRKGILLINGCLRQTALTCLGKRGNFGRQWYATIQQVEFGVVSHTRPIHFI